MNLNKLVLGVLAGVMALSPAAAFAQLDTDTNDLESVLQVPFTCSIDDDHVVNLTARSGVQSRWGGDSNAFRVNQNGSTLWSLNNWEDVSLPVGSVPNDSRTRLSINVDNNRGTAGAPGAPSSTDRTLHYYRDGAPQELVLNGVQVDRPFAAGAMITESTGPLLAGAEYRFRAELTCVVAPGNGVIEPSQER